jgi:hypothetical protein
MSDDEKQYSDESAPAPTSLQEVLRRRVATDPREREERIELCVVGLDQVLGILREVQVVASPDTTITPRDISIAITHVEDALVRLVYGTPRL